MFIHCKYKKEYHYIIFQDIFISVYKNGSIYTMI